AAALAVAQSAPDNEDKRESQQDLFGPGNAASPEDAADRAEAEAADKKASDGKASDVPSGRASVGAEVPAPPPSGPESTVAATDPVIEEVRVRLGALKASGDLTAPERTALIAFYADRKTPVWVAGGDFTDRARHAMAEIARADDWG